MSVAVYVPLLLSLLAAVSAPRVADRLEPAAATWLLTAVALAAVSMIALAALAGTVIGQLPLLAAHGHWSAQVIRRDDPTWTPVAITACILLAAAITAACRVTGQSLHALASAAHTSRSLPAQGRLAVIDDPAPEACAVPGRPGRIVVSTGMLAALDDQEQHVLIAHERAHLATGHYLFITLAQVAAAANPLLRPLAAAVRYTTERWADEHAARQVGDRRLAARTIGKAALLTRAARSGLPAALPVAARGLHGIGPVPRRVAALLAPPPGRRPLLLIVALALLAVGGITTLEAARDFHVLFGLAASVPASRQ
jgi:Zn-dependent protease with chaperone function